MCRLRLLLLAAALAVSSQAVALEPDEILDDPVLEERAREISQLLRCLVCQNETIDESNAPLAKDLRLLVRDLLEQGQDDDEILDHVVERYGEFVLFKPRMEGANLVLYLAGPGLFAAAAISAFVYLRRRNRRVMEKPAELDEEENRLLDDLVSPDRSGRMNS